jgi:hypothetical protein
MIAPERAMSYRKQTDTQLARATRFAPVLVSRMALGPLIQTLSLGIVNAPIATEENQLDRLPQRRDPSRCVSCASKHARGAKKAAIAGGGFDLDDCLPHAA